MKSWPSWVFFLSMGVLWGLPRVPHYHEDLPYIYDLGGLALVACYIGLGFFSLGFYLIVTEGLRFGVFRVKRRQAVFLGGGALILAVVFGWLYLLLLELSVTIS